MSLIPSLSLGPATGGLLAIAVLTALPQTASAAEVVWLAPPVDTEQSARVIALAEATGPGIALEDLPGLAAGFRQDRDEAALETLSATLRDVRMFEQRLDGELLIMRDLERPIEAIELIRDGEDREVLFAALAYQGFAVDRFFEDAISEDERAADYRTTVGGTVVPRPWTDAAAMEPERAISAYEIAEAPQRVHYEAVRGKVAGDLPGTLTVPELPDGVELVVDGRRITNASASVVRVPPGRHFAHLLRDGRVISRWTGRVDTGARVDLPLRAPDLDAARTWADNLPAAPPASLLDDLRTLGDEVWLVDPRGKGRVFAWTPEGVRELDDVSLSTPGPALSGGTTPTVGVAVGPGWLANRDFYFQNPVEHEATFGTVNAGGLVVSASAGADVSGIRVEGGADVWWTPGKPHVAAWREEQSHVRAFVHVAAGLPEAKLAVGWFTPHHVGFGPRLALPIGPIELVANGTFGIAGTPDQEEGTWEGTPIYSAWVGAGWRLSKPDKD